MHRYRQVYSFRPGKAENTLAFLTYYHFNNLIVEGHKVLSDRIIESVSKALYWNILTISLEKELGSASEIPYQEFTPHYRDWFIYTIKLFRVLKTYDVDVLHILAYNKLFPTLFNKIDSIRIKSFKVILHLYFHPQLFNDLKYYPLKFILKQQMADVVLVASKALKKYLVENMVLPSEYIRIIYPIVPHSFFEYDYATSKKVVSQKRREYGLDESDFVVTYIGHIIPQRGIFELLKAFKEASACISSLKLLIAHSGIVFRDLSIDYLTMLKQLIAKYGLEKKVILVGKQDLKSLYTISDILFFGFRDSFLFTFPPLVVCEAMAAGVPFILRRSILVKELFESFVPVPLYGNVDELTNVLCELPDKSTALLNVSNVIRSIAVTKFHPSIILPRLLKLYYEMGSRK